VRAGRVLRFDPGKRYTIHLKDGQIVTGKCVMSSPRIVWLVHAAGFFTVRHEGIQRFENLDVIPSGG
jgi:hypothetical protein